MMTRKSHINAVHEQQPASLLSPSAFRSSNVADGSSSRSSINNDRGSLRSPSSNTSPELNYPSPLDLKSPSSFSSIPSPLGSPLPPADSTTATTTLSAVTGTSTTGSLDAYSNESPSSSPVSSPSNSPSLADSQPPPLPTSLPPLLLDDDTSEPTPTARKRMLRPAPLPTTPPPDFYTAVSESEFGANTKALEERYLRHSVTAVHRVSVALDKHDAQQQNKLVTVLHKKESNKNLAKKEKPEKAPAPALVIKKTVAVDPSTPMYVDRWGDVHTGERKEEISAAQQKKITKKATSRETKWLAMAGRWREVSTKNKAQLRRRIRKGIPDSLRPLVWPHLCCSAIEKSKVENKDLYQHLLSQPIAPADDEQIRKDLPRAFQTHVMFKSPEAGSRDVVCIGQASLYNILKAYSIRHSTIGYVQGMGGLAGLCLMYLPEEDAYWMLEVLLSGVGDKEGLSQLYEKGMPLAFEYLAIYEALLRKRLPVLAAHLESLGVLPTSYAFRWLTTRFALFPKGLMIRIFDIFLHEGMKIIFRVCLYFMARFSKDMLKLDYEGVSTLLESLKTHPCAYEEDEVIQGALKIKLKSKVLAEMSRVYRAGTEQREDSAPTPRSQSRQSRNT